MANQYRYNTETCRYEPVIVTPRLFLRRTALFFTLCFAVAFLGVGYVNLRYPKWDEELLQREQQRLSSGWITLGKELADLSRSLTVLETDDDYNYRTVLDLPPLPPEMRQGGTGGREHLPASQPAVISKVQIEAKNIVQRLHIQDQSLRELLSVLLTKEKSWASRPAIQPISNEELTRLHTTYGMRWNPGGFWRPHKGLDFSAPPGTPVYATGDGQVTEAHYSDSFGKVIYVNHGFGFETRYAHLSKFAVAPGNEIKRGQIIGFVGNTGHSFGDHLHYEVLYNGMQVNPINFFQRDLNQSEFEKLIEIAGKSMSSLD